MSEETKAIVASNLTHAFITAISSGGSGNATSMEPSKVFDIYQDFLSQLEGAASTGAASDEEATAEVAGDIKLW